MVQFQVLDLEQKLMILYHKTELFWDLPAFCTFSSSKPQTMMAQRPNLANCITKDP